VTIFTVAPRGIGRVDYSGAIEVTTEPFVAGWQEYYAHRSGDLTIPPVSDEVYDVPVTPGRVVLVYDYFATTPSNRLVRMAVDCIDVAGLVIPVFDKTAYQTIIAHLDRGFYFMDIIRVTITNFGTTPLTNLRIGCAGIHVSKEEFTGRVVDIPGP